MCLWNELRVYLRNYFRIQVRHISFREVVLRTMSLFMAVTILDELLILFFHLTSSNATDVVVISSTLRTLIISLGCYSVYRLWIIMKEIGLFPEEHLANLLGRHLSRIGWLFSLLHTQVTTLLNQDPMPPRLSEPGFQAPTIPPEYQPPLLAENLVRRAIHERTHPTSLVPSSKHEKDPPLRTITTHRQTQDYSERSEMPSFPNIIQALLSKKPRHTTAAAEEPWQTNVPRSTDVRAEVRMPDAPDDNRQVPNIPVTDYPVNYGASTSRAADYMEFIARQPRQPTYKKKRSTECRQSGDKSATSENMDLDKTPETADDRASDGSSTELSGSSNKSSPRRSDGSPARSSSSEKSTDLDTQQSVAATKVSSDLCEYLGSRTKGTQKDSSDSERPALEMSEHMRSKLIADASTAETSFSHAGVKDKPKSIVASVSPEGKKSAKSKSLLSSPSTLNIPSVHRSRSGKRKKETSSEDEDAASAQKKKRSPSKKPRQKLPKTEEKDESNSSETDQ